MTRQELLATIKQVAAMRVRKNKRKAKLLLSTIRPHHFFDLLIPMSTNGYKVPFTVWLAYVERNWDHGRCEIYLNDLIKALESEKTEKAEAA